MCEGGGICGYGVLTIATENINDFKKSMTMKKFRRIAIVLGKAYILRLFLMIDCQVKCNTIREKIFEAPRRESEN